tara:strand:+ start:619 stop:945 length:327 start_codon:yes stop_codon:yes gene_type:complete
MEYIHKNILGTTGLIHKVYPKVSTTTILDTLVISNIHNTDSCILDIFLFRGLTSTPSEKFYIIKNLTILKGTSITFDSIDIGYDNTLYDLYLELKSNASKIDLKLKTI